MEAKVSLCFLTALILSVSCQDPIVTITETDPLTRSGIMECERDSDVTMSCQVDNKQADKTVRWKSTYYDANGNLQFNTISTDTSVEDTTKYSIEKPTAFTWRLRVKAIQIEDSGKYTCFVYTTRDNMKSANRTIIVAFPPYLIWEQTSSDMSANQGDSIDLKCNATGRPNPTIQWTRLGGALLPIGKEMHFDSLLALTNIQPEDRGTYVCQAFNLISGEVRKVVREVQLDVRFPPLVTPAYREVYQAEGCFRIELQCLIEANPFPERIVDMKWVRGATTISQSFGRYHINVVELAFNRLWYELIIDGVESTDFGDYRCQITNSEGTTSGFITLRESDSARPSLKLNRIIACGGCSVHVYISTVFVCLLAGWISKLH